ncbi:type I-G CRISPR-associated helicase/endonuclease Cas3g [Actinomadura scrupuli]|uniref:type I-G CRISPR-associated helicase/endonuclease Cas3g n=1 Tax=Actinomadura scrupuli TaxID=559629 RepID=UPI003D959B92
MSGLGVQEFAAFLAEVHGRDPYPWQTRLVRDILDKGAWPDVLDVPTGLGKTTVIDIAVFVAAARPEIARRRVFFVVDRRLVVDEAHEHAETLATALREPPGPVTTSLANRLRQNGDDGPPLEVTRMRGGTTWSWRWLERPDRHAVVVGTVDQIGSRLLFRGYGVGEFLRPIDAALTGADSLIVIDEAHLAEPLRTTLKAALPLQPGGMVRTPIVLTMSATVPPGADETVFRTDADDLLDEHAGPRLRAPRTLNLLKATATRKNVHSVMPRLLADWATALAGEEDSGKVILAVCNTVGRARAVHTLLEDGGADTVLLTGRSRAIDREYLLHEYYPRIRAGRTRQPGKPLIVCATQTIEVGANIDADGLVTESASLAALVQRFGRLNRFAQLDGAPVLVIHDPTVGEDDPVYGAAREATWQWLTELIHPLAPRVARSPAPEPLSDGLLVSPSALSRHLRSLEPERKEQMREPAPYVPVLFPQTLAAWTRTSPIPHPDPPIAPYLHGLDHGAPDVSIVWRSGLPADQPGEWAELVEPLPPAADESIEVPLPAMRRWLAGLESADVVGDIEGQADRSNTDEDLAYLERRVLRYRSNASAEPVHPKDVRPGDLIVVPASWGGCDDYGWNPTSTRPVTDLGDLAFRRGRPAVRLRPELVQIAHKRHDWLTESLAELVRQAHGDAASEDRPMTTQYRSSLRHLMKQRPANEADLPLIQALTALAANCEVTVAQSTVMLTRKGGGWTGDVGPLGSSALNVQKPIELYAHQLAVAGRAAQFATNLGLAPDIVASVKAAALWHDEGKRDPRFQAMLHHSPPRAVARTPERALLAKSGLNATDRAAFRKARVLAGYPDGMRHEALSAQITREVPRVS